MNSYGHYKAIKHIKSIFRGGKDTTVRPGPTHESLMDARGNVNGMEGLNHKACFQKRIPIQPQKLQTNISSIKSVQTI